jgi:uncharacterized protein (DUF58 family)
VVAVLGLSLATAGNPQLGFFIFLAAAGVLLMDAVVAVAVTREVRITARAVATDLVVGDQFSIHLTVERALVPVFVGIRGAPAEVLQRAEATAQGTLDGTAQSRGVVASLSLDVMSRGVAGLVGCVRAHTVALPRPLEIGPRPVNPQQPLPELTGGWGDGPAVPAPAGDVVRAVREYLPGDSLRQVHWRATAHHGELVVKEAEEPQSPRLSLVLELGADGPAGEEAAGRASWYASEALRRGYQVVLTTFEMDGTVAGPVATALMVNRRLARAVRGRPRVPARERGRARVLMVTDGGDWWR